MDIFHIVDRDEWNKAKKEGTYHPSSLDNEGFVHLSKADQILEVANNFYKGQKNLIILRVDSQKLQAELKVEPPLEAPFSGILYPHLYGDLNIDAVEAEVEFPCKSDGTFDLPELF